MSTVQCPAHDVRYDSSGVILSPGWPESYPNLQMCSWSITVEKGYNVTITFESFHTEREFDVLEIFDGKTHTHTIQWSPGENQTYSYIYRLLIPAPAQNKLQFLLSVSPFCVFSSSPSSFYFPRSLSGSTANSPTLATLSGDLPTPFNLTTSGHQFLVRWSSDHGTNKRGFKIRYVGEYQSMYPNFTFTTTLYYCFNAWLLGQT